MTQIELQLCRSSSLDEAYGTRQVPTLSSSDMPMDVYIPKEQGDFTDPSHEMGIRGRCVVLRKPRHDDCDRQSRFHRPF